VLLEEVARLHEALGGRHGGLLMGLQGQAAPRRACCRAATPSCHQMRAACQFPLAARFESRIRLQQTKGT
jgi:hypothetical protein